MCMKESIQAFEYWSICICAVEPLSIRCFCFCFVVVVVVHLVEELLLLGRACACALYLCCHIVQVHQGCASQLVLCGCTLLLFFCIWPFALVLCKCIFDIGICVGCCCRPSASSWKNLETQTHFSTHNGRSSRLRRRTQRCGASTSGAHPSPTSRSLSECTHGQNAKCQTLNAKC